MLDDRRDFGGKRGETALPRNAPQGLAMKPKRTTKYNPISPKPPFNNAREACCIVGEDVVEFKQ
jgi:hypothetical protein